MKVPGGCVLFVLTAFLTLPLFGGEDAWPQWGGPERDFKVSTPLAQSWPESGPKTLWKRALGKGHASMAAGDGVLYVFYGEDDNNILEALDASSGKTLWKHSHAVKTGPHHQLQFGNGPNATPLLMKDRVVTIGYTGILHCLSRKDGQVLWSHNLITDFGGKDQKFGYSISPLLYKGNAVVLTGGKQHGALAFKPDGSIAWKTPAYDVSYSSPKMIEVDGQDQLVFFGAEKIMGVAPVTGELLWEKPCVNRYSNNAADPIWIPEKNLLWVASQMEAGTRALRLSQKAGKTQVEEVWFNEKVKDHYWNAIPIGDHMYLSLAGGSPTIAAVHIPSGKIEWKERGFSMINAIATGNQLVFLDHNGVLGLAKVSPEKLTILAKHKVLEKEARTPPILVGTTLYARDLKNLVAIDLKP